MVPTFYFKEPFAESGDVTAIPIDSQPDGSVSFEDGFTEDYEQDPLINPLTAKDVPRRQTNSLYNVITSSLKEYQEWGTPNYITEDDNLGTPFAYSKYAYVLYDDEINGPRIFQSNQDANEDEPAPGGVISAKWILRDYVNSQATTYNNVTFNGAVANGNVVYWDTGSSTYKQALANGSASQNALGVADVTNNRVISFGVVPGVSGFTPGAVYYLSGTVAGALTSVKPASNIVQVAIARDATTLFLNIQAEIPGSFLPIGTMIEFAGTAVQAGFLACDGSAISRTTYATLFANVGTLWGAGNGTTTFNLPDTRRLGGVGTGGSATSGPGTSVGNTFLSQLQAVPSSALPAHAHGVTDDGHHHAIPNVQDAPGAVGSGAVGFVGIQAGATDPAATGISVDSAGSGATSLNTYGPSYVCSKQIFTGVF